jgi:hypothetical protein
MPIATPDRYVAMLDRAKEGGFAYPAISVTRSQTLNAALQGFAEADSVRRRVSHPARREHLGCCRRRTGVTTLVGSRPIRHVPTG